MKISAKKMNVMSKVKCICVYTQKYREYIEREEKHKTNKQKVIKNIYSVYSINFFYC